MKTWYKNCGTSVLESVQLVLKNQKSIVTELVENNNIQKAFHHMIKKIY